jgi:putative spermidine/putrescine transport system substrate-binding protein
MRRYALLPVMVVATMTLAVGCGSSGGGSATGAGGFTPPNLTPLAALGTPEGQLNILAWPGYAENGSTDKTVDWVTPFEKETGCKVNVKTFATSDESVQLMKTGEYDVVSASGDGSLRLIAAGTVEPVNLDLVPNYADIFDSLKMKPWNSVKGTAYGIPHGRGANLLMWRTDKVKPAPDSWSVVWDASSPYKGKVTAYDSPIYLADAAVYLKATRPELKITNPYALDDTQFAAAVDLLKKQKSVIGEYWSDYAKSQASFKSGNSVVGTTWQVIANLATAEKTPVQSTLPKEGSTGWSDTWMVGTASKHKTCAYKWMNYVVSPKVNAAVASWFGEAPANAKACDVLEADPATKGTCATYHADDETYFSQVSYWTTPIKDCLDGRGPICKGYDEWVKAWQEVRG